MEVEGSVEEKEEGDEEEKTEAETEEKEERRVMKRRKLMQRRRRRKWAMKRIKLKQRQRRKMVKIILRNQKKKIRQGIVRVRKDRKSVKEGWLFWFGPLNEVYMPHDYYISHSSGVDKDSTDVLWRSFRKEMEGCENLSQLREDMKKGVYVDNLSEHSVVTVNDVLRLLVQI
ncbi:hypothetical protein P8452_26697 [Trifolium repens]|nr:hypothetical protein P8452_26697 [Trifolium repens]